MNCCVESTSILIRVVRWIFSNTIHITSKVCVGQMAAAAPSEKELLLERTNVQLLSRCETLEASNIQLKKISSSLHKASIEVKTKLAEKTKEVEALQVEIAASIEKNKVSTFLFMMAQEQLNRLEDKVNMMEEEAKVLKKYDLEAQQRHVEDSKKCEDLQESLDRSGQKSVEPFVGSLSELEVEVREAAALVLRFNCKAMLQLEMLEKTVEEWSAAQGKKTQALEDTVSSFVEDNCAMTEWTHHAEKRLWELYHENDHLNGQVVHLTELVDVMKVQMNVLKYSVTSGWAWTCFGCNKQICISLMCYDCSKERLDRLDS